MSSDSRSTRFPPSRITCASSCAIVATTASGFFSLELRTAMTRRGFISGTDIKARWSSHVATPEGHDSAKFMSLIGKYLEVDTTLIDLHVSTHSLKQYVNRLICGVIRVGKIFGNGEHNLGIRHSCSSQQP